MKSGMGQSELPQELAGIDGLGDRFAALLHEACGGRLGPISWFRTDWQRGGARTGRSTFRTDEGGEASVVIKIPIGPTELLWNQRLQPNERDAYGITARLFACGQSLGNYDLVWIVMERFPEGPLFALKRPDAIDLMADAAARFYWRASDFVPQGELRREDWNGHFNRAREQCQTNSLPEMQRWNKVLKSAQKRLDAWVDEWRGRASGGWCHGDLHPANAMSRSNQPKDPAMLIDLAEVRPGHWLEDAVYLERLFWVRPERLADRSPVKLIAKKRAERGLRNDENYLRLADIRRVLLAGSAPAFLKTEGNPLVLKANLDVLEETMGRLG